MLTPAQKDKYKYVAHINERISYEEWAKKSGTPVTMEGDGSYSGGMFAQHDFGVWVAATAPLLERIAQLEAKLAQREEPTPIDMVLHCPACGTQHVDEAETDDDYREKHLAHGGFDDQWTNPPHRSHLCHGCGHIWRPADVPTNGVTAVKTTGKADSPAAQAPNAQQAELAEAVMRPMETTHRGGNICSDCANSDSWGVPDKLICNGCDRNSQWQPLNKSSKNPIAQAPNAQQADHDIKQMTAHRAAYFMKRFLHEEKLLGPNEQTALRFTIAALESMDAQQAEAQPVYQVKEAFVDDPAGTWRDASEGAFYAIPETQRRMLYTAQPKAVPLTHAQINAAYGAAKVQLDHIPHPDVVRIVRAVEAAHGIGTGD